MLNGFLRYQGLIKDHCGDIDPYLIGAIIKKESDFQPWAVRFEPNYRWHDHIGQWANQLNIPINTEKAQQQFSYGLMQIMGGTARWLKCDLKYLTELLDPAINLLWGIKYLEFCFNYVKDQTFGERTLYALACYNGGPGAVRRPPIPPSPKEYAEKVLEYYDEMKGGEPDAKIFHHPA